MAAKIKKNDKVMIIAGRSKGSTGMVTKVCTKTNRAFVGGANMVKKHVKRNPNAGVEGGIVEKEAPIAMSNIAILDPKTNKPTRVGFKVVEQGEGKKAKKVRFAKASGEILDLG